MSLSRRRLLDRTVNIRDAAIFYVATEDTHAADQYFRALQQNGIIDRSRVQIVVLATTAGLSSPGWLIDRLDRHRSKLDTHLPQDEHWLLPDIDHHRDKELSEVFLRASQKGYRVAASNPCFEVWLLLHETDDLSDVATYADHSQAAAACEAKLRAVLGSYDKRHLDPSRYTAEKVAAAEARSRARDARRPAIAPVHAGGERWPVAAGTHVHRLTERLPKPRRSGPAS